jgi:hypothetical protein
MFGVVGSRTGGSVRHTLYFELYDPPVGHSVDGRRHPDIVNVSGFVHVGVTDKTHFVTPLIVIGEPDEHDEYIF